MTSLMITMTDVFYGIGDFFLNLCLKEMDVLGHGPNIILWSIIVFIGLPSKTNSKQNKETDKETVL